MSLEHRLLYDLDKRRIKNNLRKLSVPDQPVDFVSNDYLGLARSEKLHLSINESMKQINSNGSTGSRLLSGNSQLTMSVETELAMLFGVESALIFNSGYMANLGVLSTILKRGDTVLYDEFSHACIKDGIRLSMASKYPFKHNDMTDLEKKLKRAEGELFIVVESIYSMDGDQCPLSELVSLAKKYDARIIIDEAHGTGILGKNGNGLSGEFSHQEIFCRIYTFGKAMGVHGAIVTGSKLLVEYLINFSRPQIYTTAPSPHSVLSIQQAFRFLVENVYLQTTIRKRIDYFIQEFDRQLSNLLERTNSDHAIQGILLPGNDRVKKMAHALNESGFNISPILSPTVKEGQERLRVCLHTYNTEKEISELLSTMKKHI